ncbi:rho guanine nucleotide exchange factor 18-like isoform X1 [Onychostoma macrolepis]|uniref:rho guanine nucleotide exchange factor 18-like isoform X1 n=1 Tax=Onychostoma macrolepis TaxID=369639 RepID=UPI00272A84BC|nr:rho guanine nucleotide exchange factor 18-like isoform X1 [Onychostoma macrolepis]
MADPPLHNSWPSFSWMKRWSFKRASDCKPCSQFGAPGSAPSSSSSLSPTSIPEDVFFSSSPEDKRNFLTESNECSSEEDLLDLCSSLRDSEYFRDLQLGSIEPLDTRLPVLTAPVSAPLVPPASTPESRSRQNSTEFNTHQLFQTDDTVISTGGEAMDRLVAIRNSEQKEFQDYPESDQDEDSDSDNFPTLVRSMSTSRRHSWEVPVSPIDLGRRFSLDTNGIDSDGEREVHCLGESPQLPSSSFSESSVEETTSAVESESPQTPKPTAPAKTVYSRSEILATDEKSQADRVSRILETSKQAAREAGEEQESEEGLQSVEGRSHVLMVQKVLQELKQYHGAKGRTSSTERKEVAGNFTWYEFLTNENDEEEEERPERPEKGTKVKRTLSSLRNRMTGSFNKDKGKTRDKEQQKEKSREREKDKEKESREREKVRRRSVSGHQLVPGSFSTWATCSLCSKTLQRKHGLQCLNCAVNVHKSCKNLLPECSSKNKSKDSAHKTLNAAAQSHSQALRDSFSVQTPVDGSSQTSRCASGMTVPPKGHNTQPAASSNPTGNRNNSIGTVGRPTFSGSSITGEMDEVDAFRMKRPTDDTVSLASTTPESLIVEDAYYATVRVELEAIAHDFEVESWNLAVDQHFLKKHSKEMIKRQDVIYELIQTEIHHLRTLKIMLRVYARDLREALQLDDRKLDCLFPRLDSLLELHSHFLSRLRERRTESLQPGSDRNYAIQKISDILISQFSGELGERMKESYGEFCSRHTEAVNYYKEQLQSNKKFQNLTRKISNLSIVRRLGVPECILLVTQRITKYPVLLERILHNTEAGTEEHEGLAQALNLIKDVIVQVDAQVNLYEKEARLREIASKVEPKSLGKIKDGRVFRKEDLSQGRRKLLYEGMVNWKAASGRLKDILALLLTDALVLLQEKDQRYVFSTVDNKPSVISLQKLIVREVAHEERAMFLICASSNEPEMYEIHTASKEDRNTWITHIRQAVESCPHIEERLFSEEEEARVARFREFQDRLTLKDAQIVQSLTEKLQLFADLAESVSGLEDARSLSRLLLRGDASDLQQGEQLLKGAITEVENLQNLLACGAREASPQTEGVQSPSLSLLPRRADTFGGYDSIPSILPKNGNIKKKVAGAASRSRDRSQRASSDPQLKEVYACQDQDELDEASSPRLHKMWSTCKFPESEFYERVLLLSQRLYSLQAIISQQDSHIELQRASLLTAERDRPGSRNRGTDVLLEQEKQRNLEKHREELANFQRLQSQHRQEQARWEREREKQRRQAEAAEQRLKEWEEECRRLELRLAEERQELERQRQTYQQDLERLRESTRAVEKEKERLEQQRKFKKHHTVPNTAALYAQEVGQLSSSSSFNGELLLGGAGDQTLPQKSHLRASLSVSPADYLERPEVHSRRESSCGTLPAKTEVPIHLISTTNQLHKQGSVQQQIPTKLAALSKGKEKSGKGKSSHRTDSLASVDMKQMLPIKLSSRDSDGGHKARRPISPHQPQHSHSDSLSPPDTHTDAQSSLAPAVLKTHNQTSQPTLTYTVSDEAAKEDVIFF